MIPWLLTLIAAAPATEVRVTVHVGDELTPVSAWVRDGAGLPTGPTAAASLPHGHGLARRAPELPRLEVLDAAGSVLVTAPLPPPLPARTTLTPEGRPVVAPRSDTFLRVTAPWPEGAAAVRLGGRIVPGTRALAMDPGPAEPVLANGDPGARLDLLFVSEGYLPDRRAAFEEHVDAVVDHLLTIEPWDRYAGLFNVWRLWVPSEEAGIDTLEGVDDVDTPFACHYGCGLAGRETSRLICCDEETVVARVERDAGFADGIMLLVDDRRYGGSGGFTYSAAFTEGDGALAVAAHELSHTLVGLWDEYGYGFDEPVGEWAAPNCGREGEAVPWGPWLDVGIDWAAWDVAVSDGAARSCDGRAGLGDADAVCAFPVCSFGDWVRPTWDACMMRSLQPRYGAVCREAIVQAVYAALGGELIVTADPAVGATVRVGPDDEIPFVVDTLGPDEGLTWLWTVDGRVVHEGPDFVATPDLVSGRLTLLVQDPTPFVRGDPDALSQQVSWTVKTPRGCGCATGPGPGGAGLLAVMGGLVLWRRRRCIP